MTKAWILGRDGMLARLADTDDLFCTNTGRKIGARNVEDGKLYDLQGRLIGALASIDPLRSNDKAMDRLVRACKSA
jgi:hypothetical protein